jgi:Fe2+ transport system protein FeoA
MLISDAPLKTNLVVRSFAPKNEGEISDLQSRLMHLGFFAGETIRITHRAPLFKEPFLVEVRGRLVALTRSEASLVEVEVKNS